MRLMLLAVLPATLAMAQSSRVFHLTQNQTPHQMNQIATLIRSAGDIPHIAADSVQRTVAVTGTAAQINMAGWIIRQIDRSTAPVSPQDYHAGAGDTVRLFFLTNVSTVQQLQEIATNLRSIVDIKRLFTYDKLNAVAIRGTSTQTAMAAWLVSQLDQAAGTPSPPPNDFKLSSDDVAQVFNVTNPQVPRETQEIVTLIRSVADVQRIFVYNARKAIVMRTSPDRMALAAWLVKQLDRPPNTPSVTVQYPLPVAPGNIVGVFYLPNPSRERLNEAATQVRTTAQVQRLFTYSTLGALAVRGTTEQLSTAEKVIEEMRTSR